MHTYEITITHAQTLGSLPCFADNRVVQCQVTKPAPSVRESVRHSE